MVCLKTFWRACVDVCWICRCICCHSFFYVGRCVVYIELAGTPDLLCSMQDIIIGVCTFGMITDGRASPEACSVTAYVVYGGGVKVRSPAKMRRSRSSGFTSELSRRLFFTLI